MSAKDTNLGARFASLAMYRDPLVIAEATRGLWAHLREQLCAAGLADVPEALDEAAAHDAGWLDPRLLLTQTCGYPLATRLRGRVRVVATPVYDHPGCQGPLNGSFVIVRSDATAATVADLRGGVAAINDRTSNSGMNLMRHSIAPHAAGERFFARVVESGSHRASLTMVAQGQADVAAIDCVTFGNLARFAAESTRNVRILAETAKTPGLPFITRASANDGEVALLRGALDHFAHDPAAKALRDTLGLSGFAVLPESAYDAALALEQEAIALGYPSLV